MTKISNLYALTNYITANTSGNVVIVAPTSGTALYVTGSAQVTGQLTLGSTITNGTYTYTLPSATGTLALASSLGSYVPYTGATQGVNIGVNMYTGGYAVLNGAGTNQAGVLSLFKGISRSVQGNGYTNLYAEDGKVGFNDWITGNVRTFEFSLASITAGVTRVYTLPDASGTIALTSNLSSYLPLSGGTLTGALTGTSATFSGEIQTTQGIYINRASLPYIQFAQSGTAFGQVRGNGTTFGLTDANGTTYYLGLNASSGAATFASSVTATNLFTSFTASYSAEFYRNNGSDSRINITNTTTTTGADKGLMLGEIGLDSYFYNYATGAAIFGTSATERMRITSGGNVLIGQTATSARLSVTSVDSGSSNYALAINNTSGGLLAIRNDGYVFIQRNTLIMTCGTGTYDGMWIQNISNNTSATAIRFKGWNDTTTGSIATYVNLTTYNTSSDYRLKEDLKQFSGLDLVSKLKMYDFKWKEADWRMYGGLAHEIQEVLPYAVTGTKDGNDTQGVDYSTIVPLLIQSIKELKSELDTLKNK